MFCNNCGTEISDGTNTCPNCGAVVDEVATATITDNQPEKKSNATTVSIILCIVGSIASLFILFSYFNCK